MHPDEVETDVELVRRLVADQFPQWIDLPIEPVGERGTDNILYRLGDDLVARLPGRRRPELALKKECMWLPKLAPLLPLEVPLPRGLGRPTGEFPYDWAVYRWLHGEPVTPEGLADRRRAAQDLAGFLAALQRIDTSGAPAPGEHNVYRGCPLALRDESTRTAIGRLAGEIDAPAVTEIWEEALAAPEWDRPPVWLHGDIDSRNLLVRDGRLSAVLDFGCLGVGDPACEAMVAWKTRAERSSARPSRSTTPHGRAPVVGRRLRPSAPSPTTRSRRTPCSSSRPGAGLPSCWPSGLAPSPSRAACRTGRRSTASWASAAW
jgi:aminoglycoside phosphotransferase (APT) family kinase protein